MFDLVCLASIQGFVWGGSRSTTNPVHLQDQEMTGQGVTGTAGYPRQPTARQPEPEQRKPKQRRLFLESDTGGDTGGDAGDARLSEAAPTVRHAPAAGQEPSIQQQGKVTKKGRGVRAQPSKARKRPDERLQEVPLADDEDDVPATYNNMPSRRQQHHRHENYADENAVPPKDDSQSAHRAAHKAGKFTSQKRQQKEEIPAQVTSTELEFDVSDAESDEYEPTQAKAAAKRAGQKAIQAKSPTGNSRDPHQGKHQGHAKQAGKAAKQTTEEGQAKRPRGRPRKALPQQGQQPKPARKRKAVDATDKGVPDEDQGGKAIAKPRKQNAGRPKTVALPPVSEESEGQGMQVWVCMVNSACRQMLFLLRNTEHRIANSTQHTAQPE